MREYVFGETQRNKQKKIHFSEDQNKIKTKSKYIYWANITLLLRWMNWNKNNKHFAHNDNNAQHVNYEWFLIKKENYCVVYICVCLHVFTFILVLLWFAVFQKFNIVLIVHLDQGSENTIICSQNRRRKKKLSKHSIHSENNASSFLLDSVMNTINTEYSFIIKWLITITINILFFEFPWKFDFWPIDRLLVFSDGSLKHTIVVSVIHKF